MVHIVTVINERDGNLAKMDVFADQLDAWMYKQKMMKKFYQIDYIITLTEDVEIQ